MAGSRLPHFGTIFSRMTGLLETKAVAEEPIWYKVWKKYPPELEPYTDRPMPPQKPILEIVYEEDFERAKAAKVDTTRRRPARRGPKSESPDEVDTTLNSREPIDSIDKSQS